MAESFENLDNIFRDWAEDKVQKVLSRRWTGTRSRKKKEKAENDSEKVLEQSQSAVERD